MFSRKRTKHKTIANTFKGNVRATEERIQWNMQHLVFGLLLGLIASCIFLFSPFAGRESVVMLVAFNLLYVFLIFPLRGKLAKKAFMLLAGNGIGFAWNNLFPVVAGFVAGAMGDVFNTFYLILNPFLNLIWIVSHWSLSITVLSGPTKGKTE
jgi:hypothetical protein